jgi:hypothetical protein
MAGTSLNANVSFHNTTNVPVSYSYFKQVNTQTVVSKSSLKWSRGKESRYNDATNVIIDEIYASPESEDESNREVLEGSTTDHTGDIETVTVMVDPDETFVLLDDYSSDESSSDEDKDFNEEDLHVDDWYDGMHVIYYVQTWKVVTSETVEATSTFYWD